MVHNCLFEIAGVDKGQFEVIREIPTFKIKDRTCEQSCMISCHDRKLLLITPIIRFSEILIIRIIHIFSAFFLIRTRLCVKK